jgi:DDE superfamily endonuclease
VARAGLRTLLAVMEVVRPVLTRPAFENFVILFSGWALTTGTHAVTAALVAAAIPGRRHHEAFHRFFSRGTWSPDQWGRQVYELTTRLIPRDIALRCALDDTLAPKKGPHVFGIGSHLDAVHSTRRQKIFSFGHCWVVLAILLPVPFSRRTWALPVLFRLYRNKSECEKRGHPHRKKTELARELLDLLVSWVGARRLEVSADVAYCNDTVTRGLAANVVLFGAMRPDAVLTEAPPTRGPNAGRPRKRGRVMRKPLELARDGRTPWKTCVADLYGRKRKVHYKECVAQWYRACGTRLLKVVVVPEQEGRIGFRVFFTMDNACTARQILETYAGRWAIEVCFRELKQLFGFADSSARKRAAVERTAPFVGLSYSMLILWCALHPITLHYAVPPYRPWYTHKQGLCFADLLRAAQRVLSHYDILDLASNFNNLRNRKTCRPAPRQQELRLAG